ncbi:MAG: OmpA family protein, partial [Candidatus Delongbacteria bacterium]|nr:OmpA family protein [Candidatus Delongbacteria bacterium]
YLLVKTFPTTANIYLDSVFVGRSPIKIKLWHNQIKNIKITAIPIFHNQYAQKIEFYIPSIPDKIKIQMNYKPERYLEYELEKKKKAKKDIQVVEVITEVPLLLPMIFFDLDNHEVNNSEISKLDNIIELAKKHLEYNIEIIGYADQQGEEKYNLQLSLKRAESVVDYIDSKGIDKDRLVILAKGESATYNKLGNLLDYSQDRIVTFNFIKRK